MKKIVMVLVLLLMLIFMWGLFAAGPVSILVNGQMVTGPMAAVMGVWGIIVSMVAVFCVAILLTFILFGVGIIVLGCLLLVGVIVAAVMFPFLLPVLIPLFIVWAFCAGMSRGKRLGCGK